MFRPLLENIPGIKGRYELVFERALEGLKEIPALEDLSVLE